MKYLSVVGLMVMVLGLNACKITFSFTGANFDAREKTISVAYFPNRAPIVNPTLSQDFTEKLKDRIISQTPLNMVNESGDLQFEGEIIGYSTKPIAISGGDQAEKASLNRLTVEINVKYVNQINPAKSFESRFTAYEDYSSDKGLDVVEGELIPLIIEKIIEDIYNRSFVGW